eukprot:6408198-Alexandrium_andersonii.AAC.1
MHIGFLVWCCEPGWMPTWNNVAFLSRSRSSRLSLLVSLRPHGGHKYDYYHSTLARPQSVPPGPAPAYH